MFTHALRPREFFAEMRRQLKPGGHVYLLQRARRCGVPGGESVDARHAESAAHAGVRPGVVRARARRQRLRDRVHQGRATRITCAGATGRDARDDADDRHAARRAASTRYRQALDRAILGVDEALRPRVAAEWPAAVERAVAAGVADYDERGRFVWCRGEPIDVARETSARRRRRSSRRTARRCTTTTSSRMGSGSGAARHRSEGDSRRPRQPARQLRPASTRARSG